METKPKRTRRKPGDKHYVNNADFSAAVCAYVVESQNLKENGHEANTIPHYIGDCILRIAEGVSHKPNFYSYTYREEMVMDGVENCVKAIHNYNIEAATRSGKPNAFSYFTKIIWFAFLRRIAKEKKQQDIKDKYINECDVSGMLNNDSSFDGGSMIEKMRQRRELYQ